MNAVILAVLVMVALSLLRVSVVFALVVGALVGGWSEAFPWTIRSARSTRAEARKWRWRTQP